MPLNDDNLVVKVRGRRPLDIFPILNILKEGFPHWYRRIPYLFFKTIVAESKGQVIGFVSIPVKSPKGEIGLIAVHTDFRKRGIGHVLLKGAFDWLKQKNISLCIAKVRPNNPPAQLLFKQNGFVSKRTQKRKYLGDLVVTEKEF